MKGEWRDYLLHPDGRREPLDGGENLVMNSAATVLAMVMKRDPAYGGFLYWAMGDGNAGAAAGTGNWDTGVANGSIAPVKTQTALARETFRKPINPASIVFLDAAGAVSAAPTNTLQITLLLDEAEPTNDGSVSYLREWGLFGGDATAAAGSGLMINRKVHKTYEKTNLSRLERVLRFTF